MRFLLLILGLVFTASSLAQSTYIKNIKGYTMDQRGKLVTFSSILVQDGKVAKLDAKSSDISAPTKVIDGMGKVLMPGIIDAHGHLLGLGAELRQINLRGTVSEADAVARVKEGAKSDLGSKWLIGRGWNQELWSSRAFPTAASLDDAISDRPIWLARIDGHAGWANSFAMDMAGITKDTPDPPGGKIIRDQNGNATGVLIDTAMDMVEQQLPPISKELMKYKLELAGDHLLSVGITGMHDAGISKQVYDFYLIQALSQQLPVRVYAMVAATDPQLPQMLMNGKVASPDDMLHIRSVKVYGDGALGSRGAAMMQPYSDDPNELGLLLTAEDDMTPLFSFIMNAEFQVNYHAIGDKANRMALDTFEALFADTNWRGLRNRVEHAQVIAVSDLARFPALGVLPSMQPTHATSDMNMAEDRVGANRIKGAYAWKTLWESGARVPLGSDFPVELANPFHGLHAAVTRQDRNNKPVPGWYVNEALTIEQAFDGFTRTAAYAAHMEDSVGLLLPGYWADFIIVDQDIFTVKPQDIWRTHVLSTWIAGEKRFDLSDH